MQFNIHEAKTHLSRLIKLALEGEEVIIAKRRKPLVRLVAPFAPHMAEELWRRLGNRESIFEGANWPEFDPAKAAELTVKVAVQVNGKVRDRLTVAEHVPRRTDKRVHRVRLTPGGSLTLRTGDLREAIVSR